MNGIDEGSGVGMRLTGYTTPKANRAVGSSLPQHLKLQGGRMKRLVLFWLLSLVVVGLVASTLARAQSRLSDARIVSGDDVGFRVDGMGHHGSPTGTFVIRINGDWLAVGSMPTVQPAN
jgi:hypothetical protein